MRVRAPLATSWLATSMPAHNSSRVQWTWTPPLDFRYTRLDPQVPKSLQIINALILVIMNSSDINIIFHHSCAPDSPYVLLTDVFILHHLCLQVFPMRTRPHDPPAHPAQAAEAGETSLQLVGHYWPAQYLRQSLCEVFFPTPRLDFFFFLKQMATKHKVVFTWATYFLHGGGKKARGICPNNDLCVPTRNS